MGKSRVNKSVQNWLLLGPTTQPPIPYFCTATICYSLTTVCNVLQSCTYFITITYLLLCHYMFWIGIHPLDGGAIHPIRYIFLWCSWHILIQYYFLSWNTKFYMFWVVGCCVMAKDMFWCLVLGGLVALKYIHAHPPTSNHLLFMKICTQYSMAYMRLFTSFEVQTSSRRFVIE